MFDDIPLQQYADENDYTTAVLGYFIVVLCMKPCRGSRPSLRWWWSLCAWWRTRSHLDHMHIRSFQTAVQIVRWHIRWWRWWLWWTKINMEYFHQDEHYDGCNPHTAHEESSVSGKTVSIESALVHPPPRRGRGGRRGCGVVLVGDERLRVDPLGFVRPVVWLLYGHSERMFVC